MKYKVTIERVYSKHDFIPYEYITPEAVTIEVPGDIDVVNFTRILIELLGLFGYPVDELLNLLTGEETDTEE